MPNTRSPIYLRATILVAIVVFSLGHNYAQNLLTNPSFESYTSCPNSQGDWPVVVDWIDDWNLPDYFNCGWTPVTQWFFTSPGAPPHGSGYGGLWSNQFTLATQIGQCLGTNLDANSMYKFTCISRAAISNGPVYNGAANLNTAIKVYGTQNCADISPATLVPLTLLSNTPITLSNSAWTSITVTFIAPFDVTGIAVSFETGQVGGMFNPSAPFLPMFDYYYLDSLSLSLLSPCGSCTSSGLGTTWTWTGCVDTDWFDPCNWDRLSVPTITSSVVIPNVANDPLILGAPNPAANCYDITIQPGGTVNLNSSSGGILNVVKP